MSRKQALWILALISVLLVEIVLPTFASSFDEDKWQFSPFPLTPWMLVFVVLAALELTWLGNHFGTVVRHQWRHLGPPVILGVIGLTALAFLVRLCQEKTISDAVLFDLGWLSSCVLVTLAIFVIGVSLRKSLTKVPDLPGITSVNAS